MKGLRAWLLSGVCAGVVLGAAVDPGGLPFVGQEHLSSVFLSDGQAYFGHIDDMPWSATLTLRDVYYLQDAQKPPCFSS